MIAASKIIKAVSELSGAKGPGERWIVPLSDDPPEGRNHFILFLKPEVLDLRDGVEVEAILNLVAGALKANGVRTGAVRVLNGRYLGRYHIMEEHYGVINRASRLGEKALSPPTLAKLVSEVQGIGSILGGHEFLEKFPQVSPYALNIIADTLGTKKIAAGKYYGVLNVEGERIVVLNPFHPQQVEHYTAPGRCIVVIECATDTDWAVLRQKMTGATNPAKAEPGSIRRTLLDKKVKARPARRRHRYQRRALLGRAAGSHVGIQSLLLGPSRQEADQARRHAVRRAVGALRARQTGHRRARKEPGRRRG